MFHILDYNLIEGKKNIWFTPVPPMINIVKNIKIVQ